MFEGKTDGIALGQCHLILNFGITGLRYRIGIQNIVQKFTAPFANERGYFLEFAWLARVALSSLAMKASTGDAYCAASIGRAAGSVFVDGSVLADTSDCADGSVCG
jgi:hypothetical protein